MQKWMLAALLSLPTVTALAAPNDPDNGFGTLGRLALDLDFVPSSLELIDSGLDTTAKQRLLLAGACPGESGACIARYLIEGSNPADSSFDGDGLWHKPLEGVTSLSSVVSAVALSDDTTLLVLNANEKIVLVKIKDDGTLDSNFDGDNDDDTDTAGDTDPTDGNGIITNTDGNGIVKVEIGATSPNVRFARVFPNNNVLLVGDADLNGHTTPFLALITATGQLHPAFYGSGRRWLTQQVDGTTVDAEPVAVELDHALRIVLALQVRGHTSNPLILNRLSSSGANDAVFTSGKSLLFAEGASQNAALTFDTNNDILLASTLKSVTDVFSTAMVKYKTEGTLQTSFNSTGSRVFTQAELPARSISLKTLPDGDYVGVGVVGDGSSTVFRLTSAGAIASSEADRWSLTGINASRVFPANSGAWFNLDNAGVLLKLEGDDRSPDALNFPRQDEVAIGTSVRAAAQVLTGIVRATEVSVSNGDVAIIDGSNCSSTSLTFVTSANVSADKTLCLRQTTASEALTEKATVVSVGDQRFTFTTKTKAASSGGGGGGGGALPLALVAVLAGLFGLRRAKVQA